MQAVKELFPDCIAAIISEFLGCRPEWCRYWKQQSLNLIKDHRMLSTSEKFRYMNHAYAFGITINIMESHNKLIDEYEQIYDTNVRYNIKSYTYFMDAIKKYNARYK